MDHLKRAKVDILHPMKAAEIRTDMFSTVELRINELWSRETNVRKIY